MCVCVYVRTYVCMYVRTYAYCMYDVFMSLNIAPAGLASSLALDCRVRAWHRARLLPAGARAKTAAAAGSVG